MFSFAYESSFTDFKFVREVRTHHLHCPLSNRQEPMMLSFYSYVENRGVIYRTSKKLAGVFTRIEDEQPILTVDWTDDMVKYFERERKNIDNFDRPWRFTGHMKMIFVLLAILVACFGYVIYEHMRKNTNPDWYTLTSLFDSYDAQPEFGTKYFVKISPQPPSTGKLWVKVEEVHTNNRYVLSLVDYPTPITGSRTDFIKNILNDQRFSGKILVEFQPHFSYNGQTQAAFVDVKTNRAFVLQKSDKELSLYQVKVPLSVQKVYQ